MEYIHKWKQGIHEKINSFPTPDSLGSYSKTFSLSNLCNQLLVHPSWISMHLQMQTMCEHHLLTCRLLHFPFLSATTVASIAQDEPWQNRWHIHAAEGKLGDSDTNCSTHLSSSLPGNSAKVKWWHSDLPLSRLDTIHIWRESESQIPKREKNIFLRPPVS